MKSNFWPKIFVKFSKLWLAANMGLPHFSANYVRRYIERPETEASELQEYKSTVEMGRPISVLLIISSISFACCVLVAPAVQMFELNFRELAKDMRPTKPTGSEESLYNFSCLLTNCPHELKLIDGQLIEEDAASNEQTGSLTSRLLELPVFSMCHPRLSYYHELTQLFGPLGFLVVTTLSVPVLLGGAVLPLLQMAFKSSCSLLMFLVAPKVTRRVVYDRALELYDELQTSCANFELNAKLKAVQQSCRQPERNVPLAFVGSFVNRKYRYATVYDLNAADQEKQLMELLRIDRQETLKLAVGEDHQELKQQFANDCLPIVRTHWWLSKASQAYLFLFITTLGQILLSHLVFYLSIVYTFHESNQLKVETMSHLVDSNNCTIWIEAHAGDEIVHARNYPPSGYEKLNLADYQVPLHPAGYLLYVVQLTWPITVSDLFLITYLLVAAELFAWLYEIKLKLRLVSEYFRQLELADQEACTSRVSRVVSQERSSSSSSCLNDEFNHLFKALTSLLVYVYLIHRKFGRQPSASARKWRTTNSQLESAIAIEAYVAQSLQRHSLSLSTLIELMEKLEVSLRLFVEQVNNYGPTMSIFLALMNIYIYTYAITIIVYIRRIDSLNRMSMVLMISSWLIINWLLWFIASFHARAKELQPLIWSLLAALSRSESRNVRLRHMQNLWLKQAVALDRDGGLALKAFNLSITYIRSIQLFIGSATLITLALR